MSTLSRSLVLLLLAGVLPACQTRAPVDPQGDPENPPRIGAPMTYAPAHGTAQLQFGAGPYPTLYDGSSTCEFVMPQAAAAPAPDTTMDAAAAATEVTPLPAQATGLAASHFLFNCKLTSVFEDSSIAYDAAGLRGVNAYLLLPDGTRVSPIETALDPQLIEKSQGALRSYTRNLTLLFPRVPITLPVPQPGVPVQGLRLVLDGFGAQFFFEWAPVTPGEVRPTPFLKSEGYENVKEGARKTKDWTKETLHNFD